MVELVDYMVRSVVADGDAVQINVVEGDAATLIELELSADDRERVLADDGALLNAMRQVLSASGGRNKAILDLVAGSNEDAAAEE